MFLPSSMRALVENILPKPVIGSSLAGSNFKAKTGLKPANAKGAKIAMSQIGNITIVIVRARIVNGPDPQSLI